MRIRFVAIVVVALAVIGALLYVPGCDDDNPTGPVPVKDYPVYFTDINDTTSFIYTPSTGKIDSFHLPFAVRGMKSTADGRQLYITTLDSTMVLDLATGELSTYISDGPRATYFSPDGKLMAVGENGLTILRVADQSVVYVDTSTVYGGIFSADSKSFYGLTRPNGDGIVYRVSLDSGFAVTRKAFVGSVEEIIPSADESKWFLYKWVTLYDWQFEVYDVLADSIIFTKTFCPGYGWMALTPDNRYLFYTQPGPQFSGVDPCERPCTITVFDIDNNVILSEIKVSSFYFFEGDSIPIDLPIGEVYVTPDSDWLVGLTCCHLGPFIALDINNLEVVRHENVGTFRHLSYLTGPIAR